MFKYPEPRRDESIVEDHFGTLVVDPYRWMEDPSHEETIKFVNEQNEVSQPYIQACPDREKITQELTKLKNYQKFSVPSRHGDNYFIALNSGLQNQSIVYKMSSLDGELVEFLDPNKFSSDGTIAVVIKSFSHDSKYLAYGLSESGSDWFTIHVRDVETGKDLPDKLEKAKFSGIDWTRDNRGFFYGCYPDDGTTALENKKIFFHRVGTDQKDDIKVVEFPDYPKWLMSTDVSDCGKYVIVHTCEERRNNLLFFGRIGEEGVNGKIDLTQVVFKFDHYYEFVANVGSKFVFLTNRNALNSCLIVFDFDIAREAESKEEWPYTILVPEDKDQVLEWATRVNGDQILMCYLKDVRNVMFIHDLVTGDRLFEIPFEIGTIRGVFADMRYSEFYFSVTSTIMPTVSYKVDLAQSPVERKILKETIIPGFNRDHYQVEQIFYNSKDGTKIPMFIASRKDAKRDGSEPCILYGYGGFNISIRPEFADSQLFFVQHYGYYAIANIRGGGEYGEVWHNGGRQHNKQNTFDDFIAAAEYLIGEKYTRKDKLAIKGGSNGGLLVGACLNQRPDLFGAGIAAVGVMDMLRFHKFTVGYAWCSDYGNPDKKEDFETVFKYSPLHNIPALKDGEQYPAIFMTTADHDDRVVPAHSLKFIAELQYRLGHRECQKNPLLIRVETKAGHGGGKPTSKVIEESMNIFAFLTQALGFTYKELPLQ